MKRYCPTCGEGYDASITTCSLDGSQLRSPEETDDPLVGELIGGCFRLTKVIGEGGMGIVYEAIQRPIGRRVAIKVLPDHAEAQASLDRFFREAQLASELTHPNVVRPVDFGEDPSFELAYFAMELVEGPELDDLIDRAPLTLPLALEVVHQVCGALTDAHDQGIIHRDLKPRNLKLVPVSDGSLQIKVLDLGIARPVDDEKELTQTGHLAGTPWYMAPEYVREGTLDHRADLYAVGVMLYEMLCGERPFRGNSAQILLQHVQDPPPDLRNRACSSEHIPESVLELYHDLLAKHPDDRCDDAREVRQRVEAMRQYHDWEPIRCDVPASEVTARHFDPWMVELESMHSEPDPSPSREPSDSSSPEAPTTVSTPPEEIDDETAVATASDEFSSESDPSSEPHREVSTSTSHLEPGELDARPHEDSPDVPDSRVARATSELSSPESRSEADPDMSSPGSSDPESSTTYRTMDNSGRRTNPPTGDSTREESTSGHLVRMLGGAAVIAVAGLALSIVWFDTPIDIGAVFSKSPPSSTSESSLQSSGAAPTSASSGVPLDRGGEDQNGMLESDGEPSTSADTSTADTSEFSDTSRMGQTHDTGVEATADTSRERSDTVSPNSETPPLREDSESSRPTRDHETSHARESVDVPSEHTRSTNASSSDVPSENTRPTDTPGSSPPSSGSSSSADPSTGERSNRSGDSPSLDRLIDDLKQP